MSTTLRTATDIGRFVAAEMTGPASSGRAVLADATARALFTPQVAIPGKFGVVADAYALGHFVEELGDGRRAVWHGGQGHGWMTHFHAVPEAGSGIVILTNSQRSWPLMAGLLSDWATWSGSLAPGDRLRRVAQALVGLGVIAALAWSAAQPYLTVSSVFPGVVAWVLRSSLLLAVVVTTAAAYVPTDAGATRVSARGRAGSRPAAR